MLEGAIAVLAEYRDNHAKIAEVRRAIHIINGVMDRLEQSDLAPGTSRE
jgi:hypothetical protein